MLNKKFVLSIFTVALIGIAAAGTWANYDVKGADETGKITTGFIGLSTGHPNGLASFDVGPIIPGETVDPITYSAVYWDWLGPHDVEHMYFIKPTNTGNIKGDLYISGSGSSSDSTTLASHINMQNPVPIPTTSTKIGTLSENGQFGDSKTIYFWYTYDNVAATGTFNQNDEMSKHYTETIKLEIRNPDSVPGLPIE
jgi:hypothetical protein